MCICTYIRTYMYVTTYMHILYFNAQEETITVNM